MTISWLPSNWHAEAIHLALTSFSIVAPRFWVHFCGLSCPQPCFRPLPWFSKVPLIACFGATTPRDAGIMPPDRLPLILNQSAGQLPSSCHPAAKARWRRWPRKEFVCLPIYHAKRLVSNSINEVKYQDREQCLLFPEMEPPSGASGFGAFNLATK